MGKRRFIELIKLIFDRLPLIKKPPNLTDKLGRKNKSVLEKRDKNIFEYHRITWEKKPGYVQREKKKFYLITGLNKKRMN